MLKNIPNIQVEVSWWGDKPKLVNLEKVLQRKKLEFKAKFRFNTKSGEIANSNRESFYKFLKDNGFKQIKLEKVFRKHFMVFEKDNYHFTIHFNFFILFKRLSSGNVGTVSFG